MKLSHESVEDLILAGVLTSVLAFSIVICVVAYRIYLFVQVFRG